MSSTIETERLDAETSLTPMTRPLAEMFGLRLAAMEPWSRYPVSAEKMIAYLALQEPGAPRYVIRFNGDVAGCTSVRLNWLRGHYLQILAVLPDYQGRGIGQRILAWLERDAVASGYSNLWVAAAAFNDGAQRFYARAGFVEIATLDNLIAEGFDERLMRKRLRGV